MVDKQNIDAEIFNRLKTIASLKDYNVQQKLLEYLDIVKPKSSRTNQQNKALHKFFSLVSEEMTNAGLTVPLILKYFPELQVTPSFVKRIWQEIQKGVLGKSQTRSLDKQGEIDKVYEEFNLFLAEKLLIENIPFPHDPKKQEQEQGQVMPPEPQVEYPESTGDVKF